MHISWRLWLRVSLVAVAVILIGVRITLQRHTKTSSTQAVTDLAATSPLNQPGGEGAPSEAYEVYSALYQAPMQEPLVFAENSVTDIPQVNGNCLKPSTPQEHELTDAFVAANQHSHCWEEEFSIPQGYRLLSPSELTHAQTCLATHRQEVGDVRATSISGMCVTLEFRDLTTRTPGRWSQSSRAVVAYAEAVEYSS